MKPAKISISGSVGSGKSSIARMLAKKLGYDYHSVGEFMRKIADKRQIGLHELSEIAEKDKSIDHELDEMQKKLNHEESNFIIDSRLGFYFIPDSYKIFLKVDINEAAKRIFNNKRKGEQYSSIREAEEKLKRRMRSEKLRYKQCYNINFPDENCFDLIIDTTNIEKDEVVNKILENL